MKTIFPYTSSGFTSFRKKNQERFRMSFTQTYILCMILTVFLWVYYVWVQNVSANNGHGIRAIEEQRRDILLQKNYLNVRIAEQLSLDNMDDPTGRMVEVQDSSYSYISDLKKLAKR